MELGTKKERNYSLDFLRIVATVFIVLHHYQQLTNMKFEGKLDFAFGKFYFGYCVELFFILSGWFALSYYESWGKENFKIFVGKKLIRLLPMVTVTAIAYEIFCAIYNYKKLSGWIFGTNINIGGTIVSCLGMNVGGVFNNPAINNPTYYVSVLIICYFVFYIGSWIADKLNIHKFYFYGFMILVGFGINTYAFNFPFFNLYTARGFIGFFWGIIFHKWCNEAKKNYKTLFLEIFTFILIIWMIINKNAWVNGFEGYILTFIGYPCLIKFFETIPIKRLFNRRLFGYFGESSYCVFVWSTPLILLIYILNVTPGFPLDYYKYHNMWIFVVISWIIGMLSHSLIEKPIQKKLQRKLYENAV